MHECHGSAACDLSAFEEALRSAAVHTFADQFNGLYHDPTHTEAQHSGKTQAVDHLDPFSTIDTAQAVVQGGTFEDCMKAVAKNCGSGISDLDAYGRAVQFYFPTAAIRFQMTIDLVPHDTEDETEDTGHRAVVLNLADFLM